MQRDGRDSWNAKSILKALCGFEVLRRMLDHPALNPKILLSNSIYICVRGFFYLLPCVYTSVYIVTNWLIETT